MNIKNGFKAIGTVAKNNIIATTILGIVVVGTSVTALASNVIGDDSDDNLVVVESTSPETTIETTSEVESTTAAETVTVQETTGQQITETSSIVNVQETQTSKETETNAPNAKFFSYESRGDSTIFITAYTGNEINLVIPSKINGFIVTGIADDFSGVFSMKNIQTVTLPNTIKYIGACGFRSCTSLTSINIPDGVTEISNGVFCGCDNLKNLYIPSSVTKIGKEALGSLNEQQDHTYDVNTKKNIIIPKKDACLIHVVKGSYAEQFCKDIIYNYTTD